MRHIDFDPERLTGEQKEWWTKWEKRATDATQKAIAAWEAGEKIKFDESVWSDLKKWLKENVYHNKCAYCEAPIIRNPGHAEHFRPKGSVTYRMEGSKKQFTRAKTRDAEGNEIEHPGYFWLAYNWRNLLPSCNDCNTALGKGTQFPCGGSHVLLVALQAADLSTLRKPPCESTRYAGRYYLTPEDLNALEQPNLLHPYFDDPSEHIVFGARGIEAPVLDQDGRPSRKGQVSIEVYNLKDNHLREARSQAQETAYTEFCLEIKAQAARGTPLRDCIEIAKQKVQESLVNGPVGYSTAGMDFIKDFAKALASAFP
jgi:hypothetical protein